MTIRMVMASAAALALAACGGNGEDADDMSMNDVAAGDLAGNDVNAMALPATAAPASAQDYVDMASASDLYEIESAQLAMEKSQNADIKQLAQTIVADHETSTTNLKTAAGQAQPPITVNPEMNAEQQANMEALRAAEGAQFDQTYLMQQIAAHQKALAMVEAYAGSGDVPSLQQHASAVAGPVRQHLERARQLAGQTAQ